VHLFGLTGGMGSGKSTVAARLRARGLPVIDADVLAREVVAPGTDGLLALVEAFGPSIVDASGSLDRKAVARIAFADAAGRRTLDAITHPRIARLAAERAAALAAAGAPLACYEAALIVENGAADRFRPLVVVTCPEDVQIARIRARDGASVEEALARIRAQKPLAEKAAAADFVIDTTGPIEQTHARADEVLDAIARQLGVLVTWLPA
jgi:dephospho-CoA kinase